MPIINDLPRGDREEMQFDSKTKEQIQDEKVLPEGEYQFQVSNAKETVSKKGSDMIALTLSVTAADGSKRVVRDWLLDNQHEKLMGFCEATGISDLYASGKLGATDCLGLKGYAKLKVENSKQFGPQNKVAFYVPKPFLGQPSKAAAMVEVPF
jgi:hypothetical protein